MYFIVLISLYILRENGIAVPDWVIGAGWGMFAGVAIKAAFKLACKLDEESKHV
jgi:hypothetical protein